jgi:hypothetical protein
MIAWGNSGSGPAPTGIEAGEISFRVRDAYLFSLPLFLEHERAASAGGKATQYVNNDYQAIRNLLQWNAETYFRELNDRLTQDRIEGPKSGTFRTLASVGIGAGRDFTLRNLSREKALAIQAGYEQGQAILLDEINQLRQDPLGSRLSCGFASLKTVNPGRTSRP